MKNNRCYATAAAAKEAPVSLDLPSAFLPHLLDDLKPNINEPIARSDDSNAAGVLPPPSSLIPSTHQQSAMDDNASDNGQSSRRSDDDESDTCSSSSSSDSPSEKGRQAPKKTSPRPSTSASKTASSSGRSSAKAAAGRAGKTAKNQAATSSKRRVDDKVKKIVDNAKGKKSKSDFRCKDCGAIFPIRGAAEKHYNTVHLDNPTRCGRYANLPDKYKKRIEPVPRGKSKLDGAAAAAADSPAHHRKVMEDVVASSSDEEYHPPSTPEAKNADTDARKISASRYHCPDCQEVFPKRLQCRKHMREKHLGRAPDPSADCRKLEPEHENRIRIGRFWQPVGEQEGSKLPPATSMKNNLRSTSKSNFPSTSKANLPSRKNLQTSKKKRKRSADSPPPPVPISSKAAEPEPTTTTISRASTNTHTEDDGEASSSKDQWLCSVCNAAFSRIADCRKHYRIAHMQWDRSSSGLYTPLPDEERIIRPFSGSNEMPDESNAVETQSPRISTSSGEAAAGPPPRPAGEARAEFGIAPHLQLAEMSGEILSAFCYKHFLAAPNGVKTLTMEQMRQVNVLQKQFDALRKDVLPSSE